MADEGGVPVVPLESQDWAEAVRAYWQTMAEVTAAWNAETATWTAETVEQDGLLAQAIGQFQSLALSAAMTLQALQAEQERRVRERSGQGG